MYKLKEKYNYNLEGLRGVAALIVLIGHSVVRDYFLDPGLLTLKINFINVGHSAVLIFFILSGYVIGLTNKQPFNKEAAISYLKRRLIRLYPIYIICVLFGALVYADSLWNIVGNLFFLQELIVPSISGNPPVWSLNYEIVYYLTFLFFWAFGKSKRLIYGTIFICTIISVLGYMYLSIPATLSSYATGLIFWLSGLLLSQQPQQTGNEKSYKFPLISYLFLFFVLDNLKLGIVILNYIGLEKKSGGAVHLSDIISVFPFCIAIISEVAERELKFTKLLKAYSFLLPALFFVSLVFIGRITEDFWHAKIILYLFAIATYSFKFSLSTFGKLAPIGKISYALYLVHMPIMYLIHYIPFYSGSYFSFLVRIIIALALSISLSYFLETKFQPLVKSIFYRFSLAKQSL